MCVMNRLVTQNNGWNAVWKMWPGGLMTVRGWEKSTEKITREGLTAFCQAWKVTMEFDWHSQVAEKVAGVIWQNGFVTTAVGLAAWLLSILLLPNEADGQLSTNFPKTCRSLWRLHCSFVVLCLPGVCCDRTSYGFSHFLHAARPHASLRQLPYWFTYTACRAWVTEQIGQHRWGNFRQVAFTIRRSHRATSKVWT